VNCHEHFKILTISCSTDHFLNRADGSHVTEEDKVDEGRSAEPEVAAVKPRQRTTSSKTELLKKKKRLQMERQTQREEVDTSPVGDDVVNDEQEQGGSEPERQIPESKPSLQQQQQEIAEPVENRDSLQDAMDTSTSKDTEQVKVKKTQTKEEDVPRKNSTKAVRVESQERMTKLIEALRKKNKQLENENIQLEEMITSLDAQVKKDENEIAALNGSTKQLMKSKQDTEDRFALLQNKLEESEAVVLSQKATIESLEKQLLDKEKESVTANAERSVSETHIIASLRKDVEAAETLLENERRAHALSRKNFAAREQELDESVTRAAAALSESQAKIEHYSTKLAESQDRCTMLEADIDALSRNRPQSGEDGSVSDSLKANEQRMQELEADLANALREGATVRNSVKSLEDDLARIRAENLHLKQQMSSTYASDAVELRTRIKELTDTLYSKQSQIENLTAERGALQMQLDRQGSSSRSDGMRRRSAAVDKMFNGDSYDNVVPMNALGPGYERLANAPGHLGGAVQAGAKLLDTIALQAVILIRQSPLWRLGVFAYVLGMHALIYALLFFHQQVNMEPTGAIVDTTAVHATSTG